MSVFVRILNSYPDAEVVTHVTVPAPGELDLDEWWEEVVWPETGTGRSSDTPAVYEAEVVGADRPEDAALVGLVREWA